MVRVVCVRCVYVVCVCVVLIYWPESEMDLGTVTHGKCRI